MFTSRVWRVIACGAIGLVAVAAVLSIGLTPAQAESTVAAPGGNGGATVLNFSVGGDHACATMSNGRVLCWGAQGGTTPVLGDGTATQRLMPVDVVSITNGATQVAAGGTVTCALISGAVKCWGGNDRGQLGTGNNTISNVPTNVVGLASGVTSIAAGVNYACAIINGGAKCWGLNDNGQLGNNSNQPSSVPTDVVGLSSGVTAIAARQNHTCALVDGGVKCWGANGSGQLGRGDTFPSPVPVDVSGLLAGSNVTAIGNGAAHSCALANGAVKCWGSNQFGQLGTGTLTNTNTPIEVIGLAGSVTSIATGGSHTCALLNGGVKCWGRNNVGQLGTGNITDTVVPTDVLGLSSGVVAIAAGGNAATNSSTCALLASGLMKCWGAGAALGTGYSLISSSSPRTVLGVPDECIFTSAFGDDWANTRNWSNCGGTVPQAGDNVVIGRPSTSGVVPQMYATTTMTINRLRVIGSFNLYGQGTANAVFDDNIANLNPNLNVNNFRFFVISPAFLTVTQRLTWTLGYLDGTGYVVIQPGAVGTVQSTSSAVVNVVNARIRNYGTFTMNTADMGTQWSNESGGVMNFTGNVYCCSTSGGVFTNRGTLNITGTNRIVPITQYSGAINLNGTITRTTNFYAVTLYSGSLNGTGVISDSVDNVGGVVSPGGSNQVGTLAIENYYRQSPTATLSIDVGGAITGTYDQLKVINSGVESFYPGRAELNGGLNLNALNGFTPQSGDDIRFMTFNTRNGFFSTVNNAFSPAFVPAAFAQYAALIEGSSLAIGLRAKSDQYAIYPGAEVGYTIAMENPYTQAVTLQALTHTLPISFTYKPGSSPFGIGDPTIAVINNRQVLRWSPGTTINATSQAQFKFRATANISTPIGTYTSTIAVRTNASANDVTVNGIAALLVQQPTTESNSFVTAGSVITRENLPPAITIRRGVASDWFLVETRIGCPPGKTCNDPNTDLFSVTLKIAGYAYTMTAGTAPITPTLMASSLTNRVLAVGPSARTRTESASQSAPQKPTWADPPPYHHWTPGIPCDQQLPADRCDPGPDNPYRTPDCPIPIVVVVHWSDGSTTEELIACGSLYDPSGYVRDLSTNQPITNATVSLYRMPYALPDTAQLTRDCRTIETRPGGISGTWDALPPASVSTGLFEDAGLSPARIDPPVNPQLTDDQGHYGWDVALGCWFVVVDAPGYIQKISPAVGVPPAVTDLDLYLVKANAKVYLPLVRK
ncbi:MAG: hypothetical protein U0559_11140 [Anaerolineae bacterium]